MPTISQEVEMFPDLLGPLAPHFQLFNLFNYITFRTGGAMITALFIALLCGDRFILWLKSHQKAGQPIRKDGPESHLVTKSAHQQWAGF